MLLLDYQLVYSVALWGVSSLLHVGGIGSHYYYGAQLLLINQLVRMSCDFMGIFLSFFHVVVGNH